MARAAARPTSTAACTGASTWPAHCAIWAPICARKAARRGRGIASRNASCSSLACSRRRHNVTASAAAAGPDSWARRRLPKNTGDQGTSTATSQSTPAREGSAKPARNASVVAVSSVTAAVAPKRSTSTTVAAATPTASATSRRRACERASRDTPATYSVVRAGCGAAPFRARVSAATAAAARDCWLAGSAGGEGRASTGDGARASAHAPAPRAEKGARPRGAPAGRTGAGFCDPRPPRRRRRETSVHGRAPSSSIAAGSTAAEAPPLADAEGAASTQLGGGSRRSRRRRSAHEAKWGNGATRRGGGGGCRKRSGARRTD